MAQQPNPGPPDREDPKKRVDRELIELLNELRVALPGVQILFAFLLILPFQQRFSQVGDVDRIVYVGALLASAAAAALLIAPSVYHRLNFRRRNKLRMLEDANVLLIAGSAFTAIGIFCAVFLAADFVFGATVAVIVTVATVVVFVALWALLPLVRRTELDEGD